MIKRFSVVFLILLCVSLWGGYSLYKTYAASQESTMHVDHDRDNNVQDDLMMHALHLRLTQFEDRIFGYAYANEKLSAAGEEALPALLKVVDIMEGAEEIKRFLFQMPRSPAVERAFKKIEKHRTDRLARNKKYDSMPGWPTIKEAAFDQALDWDIRSSIIEQLLQQKKISTPQLIQLLKSKNLDDQKAAVTVINKVTFMDASQKRFDMIRAQEMMLGEPDYKALTPHLIPLMGSPDIMIGRRSALSLGWFGKSEVVPELIKRIYDFNPFVQEGIIVALAELGCPQARNALHPMVLGGTPYVRATAADALKRFNDQDSTNVLVLSLRDPEWIVRHTALFALNEYSDPNAIEAVKPLRLDPDDRVRLVAIDLVRKFEKLEQIEQPKEQPQPVQKPKEKPNCSLESAIEDRELCTFQVLIDDYHEKLRSGIWPKDKDTEALVQAIERFENLKQDHAYKQKMDRLLYLIGDAKDAVSDHIWRDDTSKIIKDFYETHKGEFDHFLGLYYLGQDLERVIKEFPESPFVEKAAFAMAGNLSSRGECEADIICYIGTELYHYLPLMKQYPNSPEIPRILEWMSQLDGRWYSPISEEGRVLDEYKEIGRLLEEYYSVVTKLPNSMLKFKALFPLGEWFIRFGKYNQANATYQNILLFDQWYRKSESEFYIEYVDALMNRSENDFNVLIKPEIAQKGSHYRDAVLSGTLLTIADQMIRNASAEVRRRAITVLSKLAQRTPHFQSAVLICLTKDPEIENRYHCANLAESFQKALPQEKVVQQAIEKVKAEYQAEMRRRTGKKKS